MGETCKHGVPVDEICASADCPYPPHIEGVRRIANYEQRIATLTAELAEARERERVLLAKLNTPELHEFSAAVVLEAAHQRERWGAAHDAGKAPEDWFWLLGYLGGKALHAAKTGDHDKALHHTISTAAACANWHAALTGESNKMRPGIDPVARGLE